MRKCCCCISVHIGASILGFLGLALCLLELVVLIPYMIDVDVEIFNPIKKNLDEFFYILEQMLEHHKFERSQIDQILSDIRQYLWPTFLTATVEAGIYGLACLLMIIGASCKVRGLMLPYLILQMVAILILILLGVAVTIGLFLFNVIPGVVAGVVVLIVAILLIYFWMAVQRAYVELGNNDYMYSPAPVKPTYNDGHHGRNVGYFPTSPQHFDMEERK